MSDLVRLERRDDGVAVVTLDNPKVNALSQEVLAALHDHAGTPLTVLLPMFSVVMPRIWVSPRSNSAEPCTRGTTSTSADRVRIQSPLMAVHFFRSKRAGLALTRSTSKTSAICSLEKNSMSSPKDQPNSDR